LFSRKWKPDTNPFPTGDWLRTNCIIESLAATFTSPRIETRPNWAEVSLSALRHNFRVLQDHLGADVTICAVVKC